MVDKRTTMPRSKLGERIGAVSDTDMVALARALVVLLGLACWPVPGARSARRGR